MKYINQEEYGNLIPNRFDIKLASVVGLATNGKLNDNYYQVMSIYYHFLELYLDEKLGISKIEKEIDEAHPDYVPFEYGDAYQALSNNKYFYIRNTLYIENLSREVINYLISHSEKSIDKTIREIIEKTYKVVITSKSDDGKKYYLNYGPSECNCHAPNDSLVLGFRLTDNEEEKYGTGKEWLKYKDSKIKYIRDLLNKTQSGFSSKLGIDVKIIDYSNYVQNNKIEKQKNNN